MKYMTYKYEEHQFENDAIIQTLLKYFHTKSLTEFTQEELNKLSFEIWIYTKKHQARIQVLLNCLHKSNTNFKNLTSVMREFISKLNIKLQSKKYSCSFDTQKLLRTFSIEELINFDYYKILFLTTLMAFYPSCNPIELIFKIIHLLFSSY